MCDSSNSSSNSLEIPPFKNKKRVNLRKRKISSDSSCGEEGSSEELNSKLEEMKVRQKLRTRQHGISLVGLAIGKKTTIEEDLTVKDPFNIKTGGMINMQALKAGKVKTVDDAYDTGIGTQFSAETNKRDEDEEMMKYIEEQLKKRKGQKLEKQDDPLDNPAKYLSPEEAALMALPDHLRHGSAQRSEEMLSNQMLSGIPEVDLGIEAKIRNIEATEEAKQKLLLEQKNKKEGPSQFVPTNMAVNFVQHNRFNIEDDSRKRKHRDQEGEGSREKGNNKKATDDYHYDKFKKQFRRY
ncbi:splicing factor C9orf78 homolog [Lutzomyia longipalpis]|uniref:splicing factor C9orf78 homolog n=1 Tax=Lutzomyia longipalpis TaxID=7200 RepID=UPI00248400C9|nr:splicing factor C9orf78 homolog [Lutzomyia longipalpis]